MHKAGRYTAALLLISVGTAVIADKMTGGSWTSRLMEWWPVLFILLGMEYIVYNRKGGEQPIRLDVGGLIFSILISAVVVAGTQSFEFFRNWDHIQLGGSFGEDSDARRIDQEPVRIPLSADIQKLTVDNRLGSVKLQPGEGDEVIALLTVHVKDEDEEESQRIADASKLKYSAASGELVLKTAGMGEDGGLVWLGNKPRMDLTLTVPAQHALNYELNLENGSIEAGQLLLKEWMRGETTNGSVTLSELKGELQLRTTNGRIQAEKTVGALTLESTNGRIDIKAHEGNAVLRTTNGKLSADTVQGELEAETTNGTIEANGVRQGVKARTTNGTIQIATAEVGGDWNIQTSNGKIGLKLPSQGDYRIEGVGKLGKVESALPLTVRDKTVSGTIGSGKYLLRAQTNGSLTLEEAH
ncbi:MULTISPECIES: DUF4097 family beta strand repeat-containing protein [Paenibacillus]|uniref:DUF4097 family beta strand repeat-containing protein n=1 Tax=Paenibacillus TaxID=44249 RepID=UPI0022B8C8FF|nr:DUF4097 family beta strand repeat-containing protein [Paenibacillus caseinilyticus]MCZ8523470.1 DUF4097 family beta strand repeat-containing protein [Paenibacillus caseinilyticus]